MFIGYMYSVMCKVSSLYFVGLVVCNGLCMAIGFCMPRCFLYMSSGHCSQFNSICSMSLITNNTGLFLELMINIYIY